MDIGQTILVILLGGVTLFAVVVTLMLIVRIGKDRNADRILAEKMLEIEEKRIRNEVMSSDLDELVRVENERKSKP